MERPLNEQKSPPPLDARLVNLRTPDGFAEGVLGMRLYPKQRAVLAALEPEGAQVSFKSCNEGGKTKRVIAGAILWHLARYPHGHVISTSGSYRQIADQLLPALHGYRTRFPRWNFLNTPRIQTEQAEGYWDGFSTNDPGKFEGHHAGSETAERKLGAAYRMHAHAPLLVIVDEAKTVADPIFEAVARCKPTRLLLCSSPGYSEGEFYRSHTTSARFYRTFSQKASECPHITPEQIAQTREKWAGAPAFVGSMLDAEFMPMVEGAVLDLRALEELLANPPAYEPHANGRKAFCDFAWSGSGDECVLALRSGNRVTLPLTFRSGNLYELCGKFVREFQQLNLRPEEIEGDEGGGGKLVCDALAEMGWPIIRVNNQSPPRWDERYANLAAETWHDGGMKITRREIILPDDNDLRGQLLDRKQKTNAKGKLAIESKDDMRSRGVPSPDRADAVLGAMTAQVWTGSRDAHGDGRLAADADAARPGAGNARGDWGVGRMMSLAKIVELGTEALSSRGGWDARQTMFDQMLGSGVPRANRPFPTAANYHVRLLDNTLRKHRTFWFGQAFTNERLALFVAKRWQAAQLTQAAAEWFDYVLRHESNLTQQFNFALFPMLTRGRGVMKAWVDGKTRRLTFAGLDPCMILMAPGADDFADADWFVQIKQVTRGAYARDARLRQDAGTWDSICGDQSGKGMDAAFWTEKERREGVTHTNTDATAIIWEAWERPREGGWLVHTFSPSRLDLPLRPTFECAYRDLAGNPAQPFFSLVMEEARPGWYAPRGLGDLVGADEALACRLANDYLDALAYTTKPIFTFEGQVANAANIRFAPGEVLPGNVKRVDMGGANIELPTMLNWVQATAEQTAMMPDFGVNGDRGKSDNRTATEVNRIAQVMDVATSYNGELLRRRLQRIYEHCWALLLQYRPEELSYLLADRVNVLPEEALHDQYSIRVGGSSDAWNRQANFQRAAARYQLMGQDPNASHEELVKDLLYADDAAMAKRVFVPTNARAQNESYQEALQVVVLKDGYPAPVMPDEDHAARIHVLLGALAKSVQTGEPLSPLGKQRIHEHLAVHHAFLERKDPQAARQALAQAQQLEQLEAQMAGNALPPQSGMSGPENQTGMAGGPGLTQPRTTLLTEGEPP